ncbi:protocadherin gamma-A4 isoform X2 [Patella vulgata]|nr:protocadherin gamma-A4 isoform X2 [Patella vulgata]
MYTCILQESPALDSTCDLNLNVKDPEGGAVTISIKSSPDSQRFRFTSPTADRLTFSVNYDIDGNAMPSSLTIDIEARDSAGQVGTAQIQVTVTDRNDNSPVITATQIIDLTPASPIGAVGTVQATDADSGLNGEIEYILTAMNPATTSDYIVLLESGEIQYIKKFPDSLLDSAALLTIQARDKGTPPRSTSDIVTVRFLGDTTQPTNQNDQQAGTVASETRFFDEPANIAIVTVIGIVLFLAVLVAFYFCIKKMLLGYCCGPRKPSNVYPTSQDYGHYDVKKKGYSKGRGDYPDYHRSDSLYSRDIRSPSVIDYYDNRSMQGNV